MTQAGTMKKGQMLEGIVEKVVFPNKGIVRPDGYEEAVIVKNAIPGQRIRFVINKKRHGQCEGRLLCVLEKSKLETRGPLCRNFPACGGCMYQTMDRQAQLSMKETQIIETLTPAIQKRRREAEGAADMAVPSDVFTGIRYPEEELHYRNKMEFSFGDACKGGPLCLGLHKKGSTYDILTTDDCVLVHPDMTKILSATLALCREAALPFYKKMQHTGYLRHLLVRRGWYTKELLVCLVTTSQWPEEDGASQKQFLEEQFLQEQFLQAYVKRLCGMTEEGQLEGKIAGILHIVNDSLSDTVQSDRTTILYGSDRFTDRLFDLSFEISPFSFFQPNTKGAELIYSTVREYIGDLGDKRVFDLFCGTGTIAQVLAPLAKEVIGVELVEEAVEAARENARRNGLTNCTFIAGDVFQVLDEIQVKPDVIVVDPPRDGIHPKALPKILAYQVDTIVYVSCKMTSLARDLAVMQAAGYEVKKVTGVDQFGNCVHVETVVLMSMVGGRKIVAKSL